VRVESCFDPGVNLITKSFSVALAGLVFSLMGTPIVSPAEITVVPLGDKEVQVSRTASEIKLEFRNLQNDEEPQALVNGRILELNQENKGSLDLEGSSNQRLTFIVTSNSAHSELMEIYAKEVVLPPVSDGSEAIAQSTAATRTRIRYQTYISQERATPIVQTNPSISCYTDVNGAQVAIDYFLGDNRSWDADSNAFRTRFDTVLSWGSQPAVAPQVSVGVTVARGTSPTGPWQKSKQASSESMILTTGVLSSDYISYNIKQNVPNPFCVSSQGIEFDLSWFVKRNGTFTMKGFYKPVPRIELYARDNVNVNWRTILQSPLEQFQCLLPLISNTCKFFIEDTSQF
jgi:hypothetical protein